METVWRWLGAITGSTAISVAIAVLGLAAVWFDRTERTKAWWIGLIAATLGVLGIIFTIKEELESQASIKDLTERLTTSQEAVADLLTINKEIAKRLTSRAEILTEDTQLRLLERLRKLPPKSIGINALVIDQRDMEFLQLLEKLLNEANLVRSTQMRQGGGGAIVISGLPTTGMNVLYTGEQPNAVAKGLHEALVETGLPGVGLVKSPGAFRNGEQALLQIGPR